MAFLADRRPTLASWPKRIYDWAELPEPFRPALASWRAQGLPPGNVTYIPRVYQYADSPEFAAAWREDQVLLQTARGSQVETLLFRAGEAAAVDWDNQLLHCGVTITLGRERSCQQGYFSYNKTMEAQLLPVLLAAMGRPAGFLPPTQHPETPALARLAQDSYAMYNLSKLCYRFDDALEDFVWLRGRRQGLLRLNRPRPECLAARMGRGLAWLCRDAYGVRLLCVPWARLSRLEVASQGGRSVLTLEGEAGILARFPLQDAFRQAAEDFVRRGNPTA